MRIPWTVPALGVLVAAPVFGQQPAPQPVERTLQFARTTNTQDFQEAATLIRVMADIRDVTADPVQRTIALKAPPEQAAIADWLFSQIDNPPGGQISTTPEYHLTGSRDNVLRLYHVANAPTVQDLQEMATMIRTISDIRYAFTLNAQRVIALRASAPQISMAEWLFQEVDQPLTQTHVQHEYFVPESANDVMRVFYLPRSLTVQEFQATATEIRTATQIRRAFTYNAPRALALRGTIDQLAQAARMLQAKGLAQLAQANVAAVSGADVTATFQLPLTTTEADFQEIARGLNALIDFRRTFTNSVARTLVARGTPEQIDFARRLLEEKGMPQWEFAADTSEGITRTFQVPLTTTVEEFEQVAESIHAGIQLQRFYTYPAARIIVARGTADQVDQATRVLRQKGWQQ